MRPSHDTREETVARLRHGYLAGRLGTDTFEYRIDEALHAAGRGDLDRLTADLEVRMTIGRSSACQVVLADDTVSRRHAELRAHDGCWLLRDLGSLNGTWINGRRVIEAEVRPGDLVQLGGCELRL